MYGAALSRGFEFADLKRRFVWAQGSIVCCREKKADERVVMEMKKKRRGVKVPGVHSDMPWVGIIIL